MTKEVSEIIRVLVTSTNAREIRNRCNSELAFAVARGDRSDADALRGKIRQADDALLSGTYCGVAGYGLSELLNRLESGNGGGFRIS